MTSRRKFIKNVAASSAALAIGGLATGMSAKSYRNIIGANDRINVAMIGVNSRGNSMSRTFAGQKNASIACICDVDERAIPKAIKSAIEVNPSVTPKPEKDCRKVLEDKAIDAIYIATPDHWHAPLTIMGCQAGKHVYVEKPLSHNPHEGELAIEAARKYNRVVQMGAQRRSAPILTQVWESCNSNRRKIEDADCGIIFYGENGSLDTGDDACKVYDLNGKLVSEVKSDSAEAGGLQERNLGSPNLIMDSQHVADFPDAQKLWSRTYEKGWEPKV